MLASVTFDQVKRLKHYFVPLLNSYDVLEEILERENDSENLRSLRKIGHRIGYGARREVSQEEAGPVIEPSDLSAITRTIEAPKSGQKGRLGFINSLGEPCTTQDAFWDHAEKLGLHVMLAQVPFWQAMFCLSFWEEIFYEMGQPTAVRDIPHDLFRGDAFYLNRSRQIDLKYETIKHQNLRDFINHQIEMTTGAWTRLVYEGNLDMITYSLSPIVQDFLQRVDPLIFAKIVYRIAQNPCENRSGVFGFVVWNRDELKMVAAKRERGKLMDSQKAWLAWMLREDIPVEIVRLIAV